MRIQMDTRHIEDIERQIKAIEPLLSPEKKARAEEVFASIQDNAGATEGELQELAYLLKPEEVSKKAVLHMSKEHASTEKPVSSAGELEWVTVRQAIERLRYYYERYGEQTRGESCLLKKEGGRTRG